MSPFRLGGRHVAPGSFEIVHLPLPALPNGAPMALPVGVVHGVNPGPTAWISAAVHGDEINGTEIVRRLLPLLAPERVTGTVLLVPVVDVYGFNASSRYTPDRRDLNRSFPGRPDGSVAAQLADVVVTQIVVRCRFGIDLHTGSNGRTNHPQVRGAMDDPGFLRLAEAFAPPLIVASQPIDGSLRQVCADRDIPYLIYEAGQAGRFDESCIAIGVAGCQRVLADLDMIPEAPLPVVSPSTIVDTTWLRAPSSGVFTTAVELGQRVAAGEEVGRVSSTFGQEPRPVTATTAGTVIGLALDPLAEAGDALVHLGRTRSERPSQRSAKARQ